MSFKVNKLFRKWFCFGGKASTPEDEDQNRLRVNQPKIVITECNTSPTVSRKSSSSSSSDSMSDEEIDSVEITLKTDGETHKMGMIIAFKYKKSDQVDGNDNEEFLSTKIKEVEIGSFAHGFGVREGDIINKVNGIYHDDSMDIRDVFLSKDSQDLQMEIYRRSKNVETGSTEILKMMLSNARRIGGTTVDEVEIIKVTSNWTLSECTGEYYLQDEIKYLFQFESAGYPWIVQDSACTDRLSLAKELSDREVKTSAKFSTLLYFSFENMPDNGIPVVIQHVHSGRCIALVNDEIKLVVKDQLEEVTDESIMFIERVADRDRGGSNKTFQSVKNKSMYLGFDKQGINGIGFAKPIKVSSYRSQVDTEDSGIVIIATES